jgi:hypothetical protein
VIFFFLLLSHVQHLFEGLLGFVSVLGVFEEGDQHEETQEHHNDEDYVSCDCQQALELIFFVEANSLCFLVLDLAVVAPFRRDASFVKLFSPLCCI